MTIQIDVTELLAFLQSFQLYSKCILMLMFEVLDLIDVIGLHFILDVFIISDSESQGFLLFLEVFDSIFQEMSLLF
mgnify:CR=1 FL=1